MNKLKIIFLIAATLFAALACEKDINNLDKLGNVNAPKILSVTYDIKQDNSGVVTIMPQSEGVTGYNVKFGDVEGETATKFALNEKIIHTYPEGEYKVEIIGVGLTGLTTAYSEDLTITFREPTNLEINIENDLVVSMQVNVSATAVFATVIEYLFGDIQGEEPITALPGETISYQYQNPGDYQITVSAKSGGIATLDSTFTFTVTEIIGPQINAPIPPNRPEVDVISVFSEAYTNLPNTDFNPNWGQSTIVSFEEINGDSTLKYSNLNYQGTQFESPIDATEMDYLHIDVWTDDADELNVFLISTGPAETPYPLEISSAEWVSYEIPLTAFSDIVDLSDVIQFKFDGTQGATIYLDNLYFYKEGSSTAPSLPLDFESSSIVYDWQNFDGGEVTVIENPQATGINTSAMVSQMVKNPGQVWGGSYITLATPINFSVNKTFRMKVFSPREDAKVLLKVEELGNNSVFYEVEETISVANDWEELTFDFSDINTGESYQNIVIIFDNGTQGDGSPNFTFLFDDIELTE
jgi:hypothetical protein